MDSKDFSLKISSLIMEKKGRDISLLQIRDISSISDYFLICSADSHPQVKAIADNVEDKLRDEGIKCYHKEGYSTLNWVLLDYIDVVVHIFYEDARKYYGLEKLWADAPVTIIEDELI